MTDPFNGEVPTVDPFNPTTNAMDSQGDALGLPMASPEDFRRAFPDGSSNFSGAGSEVSGDRAAVIEYAKSMLGTPYAWGGTAPGRGLDCSGFTQAVWQKFGVKLPRVSFQQATAGKRTDVASLQPGDLILSKDGGHVALYMGNNQIIEAPRAGLKVRIRTIGKGEQFYGVALNYGKSGSGSTPQGSGTAKGNYSSLFNSAGKKYGVDPRLLSAVAKAESGYNPNARSGAGAQGLMQFMPGTAKGLGINPLNPAQAIDGAARYLKQLYSQTGSWQLAIAAYNAGPGAVKKYGGIPPYAETQAYVRRVTGYWNGM